MACLRKYSELVITLWLLLPETITEELKVTAKSDDGEIMAVKHAKYDVYGLQFHPESILTPDGRVILANFIGEKK